MIALLLLLSAAPADAGVIEAERAFADAAQRDGQWTASRKYADPLARMFVPELVIAQDWLPNKADPSVSAIWWPTKAWISCDGGYAVTTGPWISGSSKRIGYFTAIWYKFPDGLWRWGLRHEATRATPLSGPDTPTIRRATCRAKPSAAYGSLAAETTGDGGETRWSNSSDNSLSWRWEVRGDGSREINVNFWDGKRHVRVLDDIVAAPAP